MLGRSIVLVLAMLTLSTPLAKGQALSDLAQSVAPGEVDAIRLAAHALLRNEKAGTVRPWHCATSSGTVKLLSGGARAGVETGRVRITKLRDGAQRQFMTFNYRRSTRGVWQTIG